MKPHRLYQTLMAAGLLSLSLTGVAWSRCTDDLTSDAVARGRAGKDASVRAEPEVSLDPQAQLQMIAREASRRSAEVGAARLLAEAAAYDVVETRGAKYPLITVSGSAGSTMVTYDSGATARARHANVSLNAAGPLFDWGRLERLTQWRSGLADVARFGRDASREQVVLEAVSAALERNRYRLQAQVFQQYVRKMSCLVEALEQIVAEDKGRASELVQARKTQAQAELARDGAAAQGRQIEIKLRKLIGDQVKLSEGITLPLTSVPDLGEVNRQIETNHEVQQLRAQADAADSYAKAVLAGQKPQFTWSVSKSEGIVGDSRTGGWQANVGLNYTLFNGHADQASAMAASKRAEAARQQYAGLIATRQQRTAEMYDVATTSFERAKRFVEVLRDSDRVRGFTFQQWSQLGRRSLFDVMSSESDHFNLRIAYVNALHDGFQATAQLRSLGTGLSNWLAANEP